MTVGHGDLWGDMGCEGRRTIKAYALLVVHLVVVVVVRSVIPPAF